MKEPSPLLLPLLFPVQPQRVARRLARAPAWTVAFTLLAAGCVLIEALLHPALTSATLAHLPVSVMPEAIRHVRETLDADLPYRLAILPFRLLTGWWATGCLLYAALRLTGTPRPVPLVQCVAVEIHAESVLLLGQAAILIRSHLAPLQDVVQMFAPPLSAVWLAGPEADYRVRLLLTSLNLFTLWYVGVVGAGVSVLCGLSKRNAFLVATAVWAVSAGFAMTVQYLLRDAFSFLL